MAYEKSYVDTLSRDKKRQLNAIIVGQSNGIDMGLIRALRNGASADEVEKTARANFYDDWSICKRQQAYRQAVFTKFISISGYFKPLRKQVQYTAQYCCIMLVLYLYQDFNINGDR